MFEGLPFQSRLLFSCCCLWGTWPGLSPGGHMWFIMPVIGLDFAFSTFPLYLITVLKKKTERKDRRTDGEPKVRLYGD